MRKVFRFNSATIVLGALALAIAVAGGAMAAGGGSGTITACVQKSGGALYQAKKCKKGDKKLSWNAKGPAGPQGPAGAAGKDGTNGANGANGAVAGFSATHAAPIELPASGAKALVTLALPAGSFIVGGKSAPSAAATTSGYFNDSCTLADGAATDTTQISYALAHEFLWVADGAVSMQIAVTSGAPSTVTLSCEDVAHEGTSFSTSASDSVITAVQTSHN